MFNWQGKGLCIGGLRASAPVVQGGMGVGISGKRLAAAVANQGGIGVISAVGLGFMGTPLTDAHVIEAAGKNGETKNISVLRQEIRKARTMTKGILGVNIMVAISEFVQTARAAAEEGIDIIFAGAGLPMELPECLTDGSKTKLVPIVSSAKAAKLIFRRWNSRYHYVPDAFVVEGPMAGGHLGFSREQIDDPAFRLEELVPQVAAEVREMEEQTGRQIPVIAAGGVYTGADIYRMMKLGASGVQMATRFVATEECDADIAFKEAYINCKKEDIAIIESPVGMPGRALENDFLRAAKQGLKRPKVCPRHCIVTCGEEKAPYCISSALINAYYGRLDAGFAFVGANGYRVEQIVSVEQLMDELGTQFEEARRADGRETQI